jgi:hypothetical protein
MVAVSPAERSGPAGSACRGAGPYSSLAYGYQVNFTAIYGTVHYAFLGDGLTDMSVEYDVATNTCRFALLLPPSQDGPFKITIAGHEFDISVTAASRPVVLTLR